MDRGTVRHSETRAAGLRCRRQVAVADLYADSLDLEAEQLGRELGSDRVGPGPDVSRRATDEPDAVLLECDPDLTRRLVPTEGDACHPVAQEPVPFAHRSDRRVAPGPTKSLGADPVAVPQRIARPGQP